MLALKVLVVVGVGNQQAAEFPERAETTIYNAQRQRTPAEGLLAFGRLDRPNVQYNAWLRYCLSTRSMSVCPLLSIAWKLRQSQLKATTLFFPRSKKKRGSTLRSTTWMLPLITIRSALEAGSGYGKHQFLLVYRPARRDA